MKARNTKTGEVVTSFGISKEWGTASYIDSTNTLRFSTPLNGEWEIIDESEPVDWSSFRREAAKAMLPTTYQRHYTLVDKERQMKLAVRDALALADELIKQLNEERK